MADLAHKYTDKQIANLDKRIHAVYVEAQKDIEDKINTFNQKYKVKESIHLQDVKSGKWTQAQFDSWKDGQVFQGKQWAAKRDQVIHVITNSNQIAADMINGNTQSVFMTNANFMSYSIESSTNINFGFELYDKTTVANLIKNDPRILPQWKINEQKDYTWNKKLVNNAITQGIIQGESLDKISKRVSNSLSMKNENLSKTFARTAMTGAQNAGRDQRLMDAKSKGIKMVKEWMATLDGRTRDSHAHIDGEKVKIGDKWHPMKFSNGCRFPGDPEGPPHEVYNCRCTMVGDVQDYPAEYERYDNIDGKPIKNMTYEEWYKAKNGKEFEYKPVKSKIVDYSKYGGKETFDILKKYKDVDDMIDNATQEEWKYINSLISSKGIDSYGMDKLMQEAKKGGTVKSKTAAKLSAEEKAAKEAEKKYEKAKAELDKIEQEIKNKGADKVFKGIWKDDVTYADYDDKMLSIIEKKKYYQSNIDKQADNFLALDLNLDHKKYHDLYYDIAKHDSLESFLKDESLKEKLLDVVDKDGIVPFDEDDLEDVWKIFKGSQYVKLNEKSLAFIKELEEFQDHGFEYSKLLKERDVAKQLVKGLEPKPDPSKIFGADAYSQARKDAAVWAKTPKDADTVLRPNTSEVWKGATNEEKKAIYDYTQSFSKFNEPLRGWEYGKSNYVTGTGFKGVGNTDLNAGHTNNGKQLNALTDIINKSTYDEDIWLQRGCSYGGMDKFFGIDKDLLEHGTQEQLENALLGTTPTEFGFMSCGSSKGRGFNKSIILNIYAPKGTKMMYVEPFSAFGNGAGFHWDGISTQPYFGGELETILQQGTQFRVTKVEVANGKRYFDLEIIDQSNQQRWVP